MQDQIEKLSRQYRETGRDAAERLRGALDDSADWVETGKRPLAVLTEKTLKLNRISHNSAARFVRVQAEFLEGTVDGTARRLHAAANAQDVRTLIDTQLQLTPQTRERIATDARKTLDIIGDTRDDIVALVRETLDDLRIRSKAVNAVDAAADGVGETVEKARREAKTAVRKSTATKRKTTRKTTAKKTTRRTGAATRKTRAV